MYRSYQRGFLELDLLVGKMADPVICSSRERLEEGLGVCILTSRGTVASVVSPPCNDGGTELAALLPLQVGLWAQKHLPGMDVP